MVKSNMKKPFFLIFFSFLSTFWTKHSLKKWYYNTSIFDWIKIVVINVNSIFNLIWRVPCAVIMNYKIMVRALLNKIWTRRIKNRRSDRKEITTNRGAQVKYQAERRSITIIRDNNAETRPFTVLTSDPVRLVS